MTRIHMFAPDFDKQGGLIPAIAQDADTGEVLMLAYMNKDAWEKTLETGEAHYWSRSRQTLWHKGGTSGHVQMVKSVRIDCDDDTLVLLIEQLGGAACHKGYRSCFYRELRNGEINECSPVVFDPKEVYK
ncbi:phosphoribosyl-AMP cyclohydrolase [Desulfobaculum sp. SPO524]|uniref:phosphoribosyl-AMP cyclohydrolase n=1 Tax=Desulfobaculum sp. SPO524 TaxID=3378071 RepID=UPI0038521F6D